MHIALHRNELFLIELLAERRSARRLGLVPLAIYFGQRMNVVRRLIVVHNLQLLAGFHREHMWEILTAFLRKGDGLGGSAGLIRSSGRDVDNNVLQYIVRSGNYRLGGDWSGVLLSAGRLLRHVDGFLLGRGAGVGHFSADRARTKQQR